MTHPFERAGLGKAPFKYVGNAELVFIAYPGATPRAGGSCDYCYTAIRDAYYIVSADGKKFKVGCDCVRKLCVDKRDPILVAVNKARAAQAKANKESRVRFAIEAFETDETLLTDKPHPMAWAKGKGLTARDFAVWMLKNAGLTGKLKVAREIEAALKERES
jgi:hypothetical protein